MFPSHGPCDGKPDFPSRRFWVKADGVLEACAKHAAIVNE